MINILTSAKPYNIWEILWNGSQLTLGFSQVNFRLFDTTHDDKLFPVWPDGFVHSVSETEKIRFQTGDEVPLGPMWNGIYFGKIDTKMATLMEFLDET